MRKKKLLKTLRQPTYWHFTKEMTTRQNYISKQDCQKPRGSIFKFLVVPKIFFVYRSIEKILNNFKNLETDRYFVGNKKEPAPFKCVMCPIVKN